MWATGECNKEMDKRRTMLQMQERRGREWRTRVRWSWKRSWRIDGAWRQEGQGRSKKRKEHVYSEVEDLGVCGTGKGGERMFSAGKRSGFPRAFGQRGWKERCARQDARTWQDHLGLSVAQKEKKVCVPRKSACRPIRAYVYTPCRRHRVHRQVAKRIGRGRQGRPCG